MTFSNCSQLHKQAASARLVDSEPLSIGLLRVTNTGRNADYGDDNYFPEQVTGAVDAALESSGRRKHRNIRIIGFSLNGVALASLSEY